MRTPPSSNVQQARQALADRLREIRLDAGLTARAVAVAAGWHESKCSRIENGRTAPSDADIRAWCEVCDAGDQAAEVIAASRTVDSMYVEWRRLERAGLRQAQESVRSLFERTRRFHAYSTWLIPGIFQTSAYTRAILQATAARRGLPDDVEGAVAVRMERQRVLHEGDHTFAILIEEPTLRTLIGDTEVMVGQLGHLLTVSSLPRVSLGIIPVSSDRSAIRPVEDFWIFDRSQVNVELVSAWLTVTQPREIEMYAQVFAELAGLAVYGGQARSLITAAIDALGRESADLP
ncbi:helix-turn-helix transcriptional regulator [Streptosporangium sp. NBC_01755]|uniref:helix-turn-helix domain-containing protein n=1 Tax=unclassified Streptosporangium TaxID=2632669 RepID=UPI002DD9477C|nr:MULTISPECIES: helix-turn-helix transcriptional regulator [unclassified Streptosporangium]WSA26295.1 helix-turn-helix transcriptional regulator [Streptosporangium sp. NBC_01810]WSD02277.1 helix-turn-helix transcriptional regulator [Streptosporangium sp. NBC_01755]